MSAPAGHRTGVSEVDDPPDVYDDVAEDVPATSDADLRAHFGAYVEAGYQRLVGQLYAITLDAGEAHEVVQDAYSRAWRKWSDVGATPDPTAWVRRVAVRSTIRSWRRLLARAGFGRAGRAVGDGIDPRTAALLAALERLSDAERRSVVLFHMAWMPVDEIAVLEQVDDDVVERRLSRGRYVVSEGLADVLPAVLGLEGPDGTGAAR